MKPVFALFLSASFLAGCSLTPLRDPKSEASTGRPMPSMVHEYTVRKKLVYTPANWPKELSGNLYLPKIDSPDRRPAVLLIHGGAWSAPSQKFSMASAAEKLAERGYIVFNVKFRLTPKWTYPAPVKDLQQALTWMRRQADIWKIDPHRIATYGYSSGGHLATLIGLMDGPAQTSVQAIVAGAPPTDLTLFGDLTPVPVFLGGTRKSLPEIFHEASPINHVNHGDPPVFLYHALGDDIVEPENSRRLYAALRKAGVPCEILWLEGRDHVTGVVQDRGATDAAIDFLDRVLK